MTEALVGTALGSLVTIAGLWANHHFGLVKQSSEEQRWYADHYLPEKLRVLRELHRITVVTHYTLSVDLARSNRISIESYHSRVEPMEQDYLNAMAIARIYFSNDEYLAFKSVLASFRTITAAISDRVYGKPDSAMGRQEQNDYDESFRDALAVLKDLLNPRKVLEEIHNRGKV